MRKQRDLLNSSLGMATITSRFSQSADRP